MLVGGVDEYDVAPPPPPPLIPFWRPLLFDRIGTAPTGVGVVGEADLRDAGEAARLLKVMGEAARLPPGLNSPTLPLAPVTNGKLSLMLGAAAPWLLAAKMASKISLFSLSNFALALWAFLDAESVFPFCSGPSRTRLWFRSRRPELAVGDGGRGSISGGTAMVAAENCGEGGASLLLN